MKGYLLKKNPTGEWKRRFCESTGSFLNLYKNSRQDKVLTVIAMELVGEIRVTEEIDDELGHGVLIELDLKEGRYFSLRCSSFDEANVWVECLRKERDVLLHSTDNSTPAEHEMDENIVNHGKETKSPLRRVDPNTLDAFKIVRESQIKRPKAPLNLDSPITAFDSNDKENFLSVPSPQIVFEEEHADVNRSPSTIPAAVKVDSEKKIADQQQPPSDAVFLSPVVDVDRLQSSVATATKLRHSPPLGGIVKTSAMKSSPKLRAATPTRAVSPISAKLAVGAGASPSIWQAAGLLPRRVRMALLYVLLGALSSVLCFVLLSKCFPVQPALFKAPEPVMQMQLTVEPVKLSKLVEEPSFPAAESVAEDREFIFRIINDSEQQQRPTAEKTPDQLLDELRFRARRDKAGEPMNKGKRMFGGKSAKSERSVIEKPKGLKQLLKRVFQTIVRLPLLLIRGIVGIFHSKQQTPLSQQLETGAFFDSAVARSSALLLEEEDFGEEMGFADMRRVHPRMMKL